MYTQIDKIGREFHSMQTNIWLHHDLFSPQWWGILILNFLFLILFVLIIDRDRLLLILFAFMVNFTIVGVANEVGSFYHFWSYPHQFLVFTLRFNEVDFAVVHVILSLIYQFFSKWKTYLITAIVSSAILCFIGIPIFVFFGMYKLVNWNYLYSFLVTILMFLMSKIIVDFASRKAQ